MNTDELRDIANTLRACSRRLAAVHAADPMGPARLTALFDAGWKALEAATETDAAIRVLEEHAVPGEGEV